VKLFSTYLRELNIIPYFYLQNLLKLFRLEALLYFELDLGRCLYISDYELAFLKDSFSVLRGLEHLGIIANLSEHTEKHRRGCPFPL